MSPSISVVIATYNHGRYLAGAIKSALAQTLPAEQIVVVDDGSQDETREVMRRYAGTPGLEYRRLDHAGQPAAKNAGLAACRGQWIAFLDADDLWLPEKLAAQWTLARSDPRVGVVYTDFAPMDAEGRSLASRVRRALPRGDVLSEMFLDNFVCFSSSLVRRDVFDRVGTFDESIPMAIDYEFWLRAAQEVHFAPVEERLVRYRSGHANLSRRAEERLGIALDVMNRFAQRESFRRRVPRTVMRRAYAETYCTLGLLRRERSTAASLAAYARALRYRPHGRTVWRGIVAACAPEAVRRWYRWVKGAPLDWRVPQPISESAGAS